MWTSTDVSAPPSDFDDASYDITELVRGAVHCWHFDIDETVAPPCSLGALLSEQELRRSVQFKDPASRRRFMASRATLRIVLGRYLGVEPRAVEITFGPHGKPQLADSEGARGLVFNVSHTAGRGVLAVAWDGQIGIDLQAWRQIRHVGPLLQRCCAESERAWLRSLDPALQTAALFRLWTLKEAFCKAIGRGLAYGLKRCVFECAGPRPRLIAPAPKPDVACSWHFAELPLPTGISGAVALDRPMPPPKEYKLAPGSLLLPA